MLDNMDSLVDEIVLAQNQPPALVAPAPNWASPYPVIVKGLVDWIRRYNKFEGLGITSYSEDGPLGLPTLTFESSDIEFHLDKDGRPFPQILNLALQSCFYLDVEAGQAGAWGPECKIVRFLEMPVGKLEPQTKGYFDGDSMYIPIRDGMDKVRFILDNGAGRQVDVTVYINVLKWEPEGPEGGEDDYDDNESSSISSLENLNVSFSDLPGVAVAQTTGTGANAQIALDTDAAGYSWFIDYTPYLNEEWLPTSNPYGWQAKPGSDAEGKMDMLSVLLHEYGHVLGLEHTADSHDFMSTTLQPGVRRLPSAEELQQMANPVAKLKGEMGLTSSSTPQQPDTP
ncbi:MAG: matrixin family metalloprotease [Candidatus Accumulibacter sp.]|jgi:hypothetical protein|nr:matrixin family metalloprotease [Accumulibacter sp.]